MSPVVSYRLLDPPSADSAPREWPGLPLYAATILLEAESESDEGALAVGWVIRNRMDKRKASIHDTVLAPWQFSCWNGDYARQRTARLAGIDPARWERAWRMACGAYWRLLPDPVAGALFYLNPVLTREIRPTHDLPEWYDATHVVARIGRHEFLT